MEKQIIKLVAVIRGGFLEALYSNTTVEYILIDHDLRDNLVSGPYEVKGQGEDLARFFDDCKEVKNGLKKAGY